MTDSRESPDSTPWWLWPNVLNLDAPIVAVVWQHAFAGLLAVQLEPANHWLLALAVWEVYFADRWLDAQRGAHKDTERHRFHGRVGAGGAAASLLVGVAGMTLAARCLNGMGWAYASMLLAATGAWFLVTHFRRERRRVLPKELSVGIIFAAGCLIQPLSLAQGNVNLVHVSVSAALFAWLCFLNCASITVWEALPADRDDPGSLLNGWSGAPRSVPLLGFSLLAASALVIAFNLSPELGRFACALALSSAALLALNHGAPGRSRRASRILADLALLTPLIFPA